MMCAIFSTKDWSGTYYSDLTNTYSNDRMKEFLEDFSEFLKEGECFAVTVTGRGDVALMELIKEEGSGHDLRPSQPLCYNVMKAFCQAYGLEMAIPEYVGPYTLEVARRAYDDCKDYLVIIPVMEEGEVCCVS